MKGDLRRRGRTVLGWMDFLSLTMGSSVFSCSVQRSMTCVARDVICASSSTKKIYCKMSPSGPEVILSPLSLVWQIVGLDAINTKDYHAVDNMITNHLSSLRRKPQFKNSLICFMPEMNLNPYETQRTIEVAERFQPVYVVSYDTQGKGRPGVLTTDVEKLNYTAAVQNNLQNRTLYWARDMVGAHLDVDMSALVDQMNAWKRHVKLPANPYGKLKIFMDGKEGGAKKDDLFIAMAIATHVSRQTLMNPVFTTWANKAGVNIRY